MGPILSALIALISFSAAATVTIIGSVVVLCYICPPFNNLLMRKLMYPLHAKMHRGAWADDPRFYTYYPSSTSVSSNLPPPNDGNAGQRSQGGSVVMEVAEINATDKAAYSYFASSIRSARGQVTNSQRRWHKHNHKTTALHLFKNPAIEVLADGDEVPLLIPC